MEIRAFVVVTELHPGIAVRNHRSVLKFDGTRAGYALALDTRDYKSISNRGAYGGIGCGRTYVAALITSPLTPEEEVEVPIGTIPAYTWDSLPLGTLTLAQWQPMHGWVWDGNNHLLFDPARSRRVWAARQFKQKFT